MHSETLIFIYNIILIILYTTVAFYGLLIYKQQGTRFASLSSAQQKKQPVILAITLLFLFYIFDNIIIYMTEFLDEFSMRYDMQFMNVPAFKTVIIIVTACCLMAIQHCLLPRKIRFHNYAALILLSLALLFIPMMSKGALKVWLYYLPCQLYTAYLGIGGLLHLRKYPEELNRDHMPLYKKILLITIVFSILIIVEDTIVIFNLDTYSDIMVKINNRSVSEDIMSIIYSYFSIRCFSSILSASSTVSAPTPETGIEAGATPDIAAKDVADLMKFEAFSQKYHLTQREKDILKILLEDKNNQEIGNELFISIGTVKTHVHNIFQKTDVSKRSTLVHMYSKYNAPYSTNAEKKHGI